MIALAQVISQPNALASLRAEFEAGVEALKEVAGGLDTVVTQLVGGLQSGMGYLGAPNLTELRKKARFIRVTPAGQRESSPHDIVEVKTGK